MYICFFLILCYGVVVCVVGCVCGVVVVLLCVVVVFVCVMDVVMVLLIVCVFEDVVRMVNVCLNVLNVCDGVSCVVFVREVYEKLGFDYLLVSDDEVCVFVVVMCDVVCVDGGFVWMLFVLMWVLVWNVWEGGGVSDVRDDGEDGDDARGDAFWNLRVVVYVEVLCVVMCMSDDDVFEVFWVYVLEEYEVEVEMEVEVLCETFANGANGATANASIVLEFWEDGDDDDDVWELVEFIVLWFLFVKDDVCYVKMLKWEVVNVKLRGLMSELLSARVGVMLMNVGVNFDWECFDVVLGLMDLFEVMCVLCDVERCVLWMIFLRALRERWVIAAGGKLGVEVGLMCVFDVFKFV